MVGRVVGPRDADTQYSGIESIPHKLDAHYCSSRQHSGIIAPPTYLLHVIRHEYSTQNSCSNPAIGVFDVQSGIVTRLRLAIEKGR